ncbi:MAG TPA: hypothetical protein VH370_15065 [Humisphaera sp.]|jgi:hypothetical protein|nr:hypothetical protein [Humisphaera sp.]
MPQDVDSDPPTTDARRNLARAQAALVATLKTGAPRPPGFAADQLDIASDSLLSKRRRSLQKMWPTIQAALADKYAPLFRAYARDFPFADPDDTRSEGRRFARWLLQHADISPQTQSTAATILLTRGFPVRMIRQQSGGHLLLLRVPRRGAMALQLHRN